ncbi:MAG: hypothetical protein DSY40_01275 [Nautilia sp.]|nr:MAG: hypothetical protein DSY40_01275 [Nautilia sp.]
MQIIKKRDYVEIDIPYEEIEEYNEMIEFLEFKKSLQSLYIPKEESEKMIQEINNNIRENAKEWLRRSGIEINN